MSKPKTCEWKWKDDCQSWSTTCGILAAKAVGILGNPCPFCGGKIVEVKDEDTTKVL